MTSPKELIEIGFVRAAHGLKGQVVIHAYSKDEDSLTQYGALQNADGSKSFEITIINGKENDFLCKVAGITDRNQAEALRGTKLFTPLEALPEPEEDAFYIRDLIGLTVQNEAGIILGQVVNIIGVASNDALEIEFQHDGINPLEKEVFEYLLFTRENVPTVDIDQRMITVNLPHGLLGKPDKDAN